MNVRHIHNPLRLVSFANSLRSASPRDRRMVFLRIFETQPTS